ncbi:MAG: hypothetical protein RL375_4472 [Pseudomonadota bacterium]|jgi:hypothetical protein
MLLIAPVLVLAGCGGGGGDGPTQNASPEGLYVGTATRSITTNSPVIDVTNDLHLLVLAGGQYWAVTSFNTSGVYFPGGFVTGQVTSNGNLLSANATDYTFAAPPTGTLTGAYVANSTFNGNISDSVGSITLTTTAIPPSQYTYAQAPSLAVVSGAWNFRDRLFNPGSFNIGAAGDLTGSAAGCDFTGTLTPHPSGKNVLVSQITFGPAPCSTPGLTVSGIAFTYLIANGSRQLAVTGVSASRTFAASWLAVR